MTYVEDRRLPTFNENAVDDVLHAQAMSVLATDYGGGELSQTLVLLTGDGNENDGRTSFPGVVREFMRQNADRQATDRPPLWKVEIITWRRSLSQKMTKLQEEYPGHVAIRYLDEHREYVTYKQEHGGGTGWQWHDRIESGAVRSGKGKGTHEEGASRWQWIDDEEGGHKHEGRQSGMESSSVSASASISAGEHGKDTHKGKGSSRWQWISEEDRLGHGGKGHSKGGRGTGYVWPHSRPPPSHPRVSHAHGRADGIVGRL
jgi:hypothetical protein